MGFDMTLMKVNKQSVDEILNKYYSKCLDDENLVNEFCRLKRLKRPDRRSPIEIQIDNACHYDAGMEFIRQFADFVMEFVYAPLLMQQVK